MLKLEICPHTENCIVYKNWEEESGNKNIDIIIKENNPDRYACLALTALGSPEKGIQYRFDIEERIKDKTSLVCSHITILNSL